MKIVVTFVLYCLLQNFTNNSISKKAKDYNDDVKDETMFADVSEHI